MERLHGDTVVEKTLYDWIAKWKTLDEDIEKIDRPFIWRKTDEYGIPDDKVALQNILFYRKRFIEKYERKPSVREVKWMYWIDSSAEGYWEVETLITLATEYSDTETLIDMGRANEKELERIDEKLDKEVERLSNFVPIRRRAQR